MRKVVYVTLKTPYWDGGRAYELKEGGWLVLYDDTEDMCPVIGISDEELMEAYRVEVRGACVFCHKARVTVYSIRQTLCCKRKSCQKKLYDLEGVAVT